MFKYLLAVTIFESYEGVNKNLSNFRYGLSFLPSLSLVNHTKLMQIDFNDESKC